MLMINNDIKEIFKKLFIKTVIQFVSGLRLDGRVVMQRPAKPFTPVRFRIQPPSKIINIRIKCMEKLVVCPSGGIGRHKGLKIPR